MDEFLKSFADKYEKWNDESNFTCSSRIIPVGESFSPQQWVVHGEVVFDILKNARSFALTECLCRTHYNRCTSPRDVCFLIDDFSDKGVAHKKAWRISLDEAKAVLKKADQHGLVHLALYMPGHKIYALCSCCSCCCHDLQLLLQYHRTDLVARSDYIAVTPQDQCTSCGRCIDRCQFGARKITEGLLEYDPAACMGCGLCISACPEKIIGMQKRQSP